MTLLTTTIIQGAAVTAQRRPHTGNVHLEFQPRVDAGLLWEVTFREVYGFTDGWSLEVRWGDTKEVAFHRSPNRGLPFRADHVTPWFDHEPTGWSSEQIAQAGAWAATEQLAQRHHSIDERALAPIYAVELEQIKGEQHGLAVVGSGHRILHALEAARAFFIQNRYTGLCPHTISYAGARHCSRARLTPSRCIDKNAKSGKIHSSDRAPCARLIARSLSLLSLLQKVRVRIRG